MVGLISPSTWWMGEHKVYSVIVHHTPIVFDKKVTFWLQRCWSLLCACAYVASYVRSISITQWHPHTVQQTHMHKLGVEAKKLLSTWRHEYSNSVLCVLWIHRFGCMIGSQSMLKSCRTWIGHIYFTKWTTKFIRHIVELWVYDRSNSDWLVSTCCTFYPLAKLDRISVQPDFRLGTLYSTDWSLCKLVRVLCSLCFGCAHNKAVCLQTRNIFSA